MELTPKDYCILIDQMGTDVTNYQQYPFVQPAEAIRQIDCHPMNQNLAEFLDQLVLRYQRQVSHCLNCCL
ncbi:hypothetical protein [Limosilactobacillus secaliphilus]|uniref:Uncharacterized protein n=1 Tax=Limosilactobacillus secaliphilus TaxID=396268 RepID=A0A0R2HZF4_9LACO|nr:hypothetical protein [Limosilactobacillus secaliphilus]KRN58193.1 hypothetical protein IV45_GL000636 [Limosilactobacillus secaliphilus]